MFAGRGLPKTFWVSEWVNRAIRAGYEAAKHPLTCVGLTGFEPATT